MKAQTGPHPPSVFISYSHDSEIHKERVLELSERLRSDGVDALIDQYIENQGPPEGWPRWMDAQLQTASFVLMICTATYRKRVEGREQPGQGHGVLWEGHLIYQSIYNAATKNDKFVPVLLEGATSEDIPLPLQGVPFYRPLDEGGYEDLYRRLTGQARVQKGELGSLISLPSRRVNPKEVKFAEEPFIPKKRGTWKKPVALLAAAVVIAVGIGMALRLSRPRPIIPSEFKANLRVHFSNDFGPVEPVPAMKLYHRLPREKDTSLLENGRPIDGGFEYPASVTMPKSGEKYLGLLHRVMTTPGSYRNPDSNEVCFERKTEFLDREPIVRIECDEGKACKISADDFGWAKPCAVGRVALHSLSLVPSVFAQTPANSRPEKGWVVPSLETLLKQEAAKQNPAFSEFTLSSGPLPALKEADRLTYTIRVNDDLIYIDGLPPEASAVSFNADKGIDIRFGLENLDFSGKHAGYEHIDVTLQFSRGGRTIKQNTVQLAYIALRPMGEQVVSVEPNLAVRWKADYHAGRRDDVYQIFLLSVAKSATAEDLKRRIDEANFNLNDSRLVAVVRPPIGGSGSFAINVGIRQPSGQVKFTFDDEMSKQLCLKLNQFSARSQLINKSAFRRNVENGSDSRQCASF